MGLTRVRGAGVGTLSGDTTTVTLEDTSSQSANTGPAISFKTKDSGGTTREVAKVIGESHSGTDEGNLALQTRNGGTLETKWKVFKNGNLIPSHVDYGIILGATATGDANLLNDYEVGDRSSGSVSGITASTNTVTGYYTKVGRQIVEHIKVVISGKSGGSGNPYIGLSFTPTRSVGASLVQGGSIGMNSVISNTTFRNTGFMGVYGGNPQVYANDYDQGYYSSGNWSDGTLAFTVIYEAD